MTIEEEVQFEEYKRTFAEAYKQGFIDAINICNTEPQKIGYCNECKWFRDKQVCGRCRSKNLYAPNNEPQTEKEGE